MRKWTQADDGDLLAHAGSDPDAFACFYDRYERAIVSYFMRHTGNAEDSADLAGEVFAAALRGAGRYRPGGPTAAAWLFTIAQNTLLKSVRKRRVEQAARRSAGIAAHLELSMASRERIEASEKPFEPTSLKTIPTEKSLLTITQPKPSSANASAAAWQP